MQCIRARMCPALVRGGRQRPPQRGVTPDHPFGYDCPGGRPQPTGPRPRGTPAMEMVSRCIVRHAQQLARDIAARAVLVYADAICQDDELRQLLRDVDFPTVLVTRSREAAAP